MGGPVDSIRRVLSLESRWYCFTLHPESGGSSTVQYRFKLYHQPWQIRAPTELNLPNLGPQVIHTRIVINQAQHIIMVCVSVIVQYAR